MCCVSIIACPLSSHRLSTFPNLNRRNSPPIREIHRTIDLSLLKVGSAYRNFRPQSPAPPSGRPSYLPPPSPLRTTSTAVHHCRLPIPFFVSTPLLRVAVCFFFWGIISRHPLRSQSLCRRSAVIQVLKEERETEGRRILLLPVSFYQIKIIPLASLSATRYLFSRIACSYSLSGNFLASASSRQSSFLSPLHLRASRLLVLTPGLSP